MDHPRALELLVKNVRAPDALFDAARIEELMKAC